MRLTVLDWALDFASAPAPTAGTKLVSTPGARASTPPTLPSGPPKPR